MQHSDNISPAFKQGLYDLGQALVGVLGKFALPNQFEQVYSYPNLRGNTASCHKTLKCTML